MQREIVIKLVVPRWLKSRWAFAIIAMMVGSTALVFAAVPNTFTSGQVVSASAMNDNFASLDGRLTVLEASPKVIKASSDLALGVSAAIVAGTATTIAPTTAQVIYGSHSTTLVCPSCTCVCQMFIDGSAVGNTATLSSNAGSVTVSAPFSALLSPGNHGIDLRCLSSQAACGTAQANSTQSTGYQYILFRQ